MDNVITLGQYKGLTLMADFDELILIAASTDVFLSCKISDAVNMKEMAPPLFKAWEIFNAGSPAMQEAGITMKELNDGIAIVHADEVDALKREAEAKVAAGESIETQPGVHIVTTKHGYVTVVDKDKADPQVQAQFESDFGRLNKDNN